MRSCQTFAPAGLSPSAQGGPSGKFAPPATINTPLCVPTNGPPKPNVSGSSGSCFQAEVASRFSDDDVGFWAGDSSTLCARNIVQAIARQVIVLPVSDRRTCFMKSGPFNAMSILQISDRCIQQLRVAIASDPQLRDSILAGEVAPGHSRLPAIAGCASSPDEREIARSGRLA